VSDFPVVTPDAVDFHQIVVPRTGTRKEESA
jgi:hypothetical protein